MALSEDDLFYILDQLWDARPKWRFIGLGLKISRSDLDVIDHGNSDDDSKFESMLVKWLRNGRDCTWDALCRVLSSRPVGCTRLADQLRKQECSDPGNRRSPQPEPQPVSQTPYGKTVNDGVQEQAACLSDPEPQLQKNPRAISQDQTIPAKTPVHTSLKPPIHVSREAEVSALQIPDDHTGITFRMPPKELVGIGEGLANPSPQGIGCTTPTLQGADLALAELTCQFTVLSATKSCVSVENETKSKVQPAHAVPLDSSSVDAPEISYKAATISGPEDVTKELSLREDMKLREYQEELAAPGLQGKNYILMAPTGTGKTLVAGYIIMHHLNKMLREGRKGKVAVVTPTRQLTVQQMIMLQGYIPEIRAIDITGASGKPMNPLVRSEDIDVIVCTAGKLRRELKTDGVKITDFTLIVADECHHAGRPSNYTDIMEFHIRSKLAEPSLLLPQVVGLTASPGAGRGKSNIVTVMEHQLSLCARMDATAGILAVGRNVAELESIRNAPKTYLEIKDDRNPNEAFIQHVYSAMEELEQHININSTHVKGTSKYDSWLQNEKEAAENREEDERIKISVLDQLSVYSRCLITYHDFRQEDAVSVLEEVEEFSDQTPFEEFLSKVHKELMEKLSSLSKVPNPLLEHMERVLLNQFGDCSQSKGIFFVRAIKHTQYVTDWIKSSPTLSQIIRPASITGYHRGGMEISDQLKVLKGFCNGTYNLLASTSVLEEGLDVPDCNFVIRYQNVSNEIAQVQAKGRARAGDSRMYTVISTNSNRYYWYLVQEEKQRLVEESVTALRDLQMDKEISSKQRSFIEERDRWVKHIKSLRSQWPAAEKVEILCKKCKVLACKGSDVFVYTLSCAYPQYVVPNKSFRKKYDKKEHDKPTISDDFAKPYRIYCRSPTCKTQWGVIGSWRDTGYKFPVLKCCSFLFKYSNESTQCFKKWKNILFEVQDIRDWVEFEDDINDEQ